MSVYGGVETWPIFTTFSCHGSDFISHFTAGFPGLGQYLCAPVTRSGQRLYTAPSPSQSPALSLSSHHSFVSTHFLKPLIEGVVFQKTEFDLVHFPEMCEFRKFRAFSTGVV